MLYRTWFVALATLGATAACSSVSPQGETGDSQDAVTAEDSGTDPGQTDIGTTDHSTVDSNSSDPGVADETPADTPANPCAPGSFCRPAVMSSCGDPAFVPVPDKKCQTDAGELGYCCSPANECETDQDCPGCKLCDLPAVGGKVCHDVFGRSAIKCTKDSECPEQNCCSFSLFETKPECGGLCIFEGGSADCGECMTEGVQITKVSDPPCCPGLTPIPAAWAPGDGTCVPPRCAECMYCVKGCGDGKCTAGENSCNCPQDCPFSFPGGPGSACTEDSDCKAPVGCLPEASGYPTGGYCTGGVCNPEAPVFQGCPAGAVCVGTTFSEAYLCLQACGSDADCRPGLTCEALSEL